jgi:hypothetical protein
MNIRTLETAFEAAFSGAIRKIGVVAFKRTSFFGSNRECAPKAFKRAA